MQPLLQRSNTSAVMELAPTRYVHAPLSRTRSASVFGPGVKSAGQHQQQPNKCFVENSRKASLSRKISLPSNFRKRRGSSKFKPIFEGIQTTDPWDALLMANVSIAYLAYDGGMGIIFIPYDGDVWHLSLSKEG